MGSFDVTRRHKREFNFMRTIKLTVKRKLLQEGQTFLLHAWEASVNQNYTLNYSGIVHKNKNKIPWKHRLTLVQLGLIFSCKQHALKSETVVGLLHLKSLDSAFNPNCIFLQGYTLSSFLWQCLIVSLA